MIRPTHGLAIAACALLRLSARAQAPCDSSISASFLSEPTDPPYTYTFTPSVQSQDAFSLSSINWGFVSPGTGEQYTQAPVITFPPSPDPYLVCLEALVLPSSQVLCQATHCELITVPADTTCNGVAPSFTISAGQGSITFSDQSIATSGITSYSWDFGDGTYGQGGSVDHGFSSPGPFQVCLTITAGACTATVCNWVYLGPPDVPCDILLHPAFSYARLFRSVALFDRSIASGMNTLVEWDLGDGTAAYGPAVVHTYADMLDHIVCAHVTLWGPLNTDSCHASACQTLPGGIAAGIEDAALVQLLRASPIPFTDALDLRGPAVVRGAAWRLLDLHGRVLEEGSVAMDGVLTLRPYALAPGSYVVHMTGPSGASAVRVVKQ